MMLAKLKLLNWSCWTRIDLSLCHILLAGAMRGGKKTDMCCYCAHSSSIWSGLHSTGCCHCRHRIDVQQTSCMQSAPAVHTATFKSAYDAARKRKLQLVDMSSRKLKMPSNKGDLLCNDHRTSNTEEMWDVQSRQTASVARSAMISFYLETRRYLFLLAILTWSWTTGWQRKGISNLWPSETQLWHSGFQI